MAPTSSSSFRRSRPSSRKDVAANNLSRSNNPTTAIGSPSILSAAAQHQYVWVSTDLMEAVLKSGDPLATNWEPVTRNRATALEWGWCRAVVLSSSITNNRTPSATSTATPWTEDRKNLPTNNEKPTTVSPFGNYTLRKCVISPPKPSNTAAGSNCPAISTLPWDTASPTKRPVVKPTTTTVAMTVRVDDAEFAPDSLQGRTVSFSYATTTTTPTSNNKGAAVTDEQRVCLANDWWTREYECDDDNNNNATEPTNEPPTDLTALEQLHEPAVVYCLLRRYQKNQIYTYTGKILLALNPFAQLPHLYGEEVMWEYCSKTQQQQDRSPRNSPEKDQPQQKRRRSSRPPPHVYAVAEDAYRSAMDSIQNNTSVAASRAFAGGNQSILVSGESGAGKTVTTKIILQYLAVLSQKADTSAAVVTGIESQVLESNPILESFGNARTVRNDNSSRFGKFLEMQFEATGCLVEASIQTYLLEKVRLISQAPGERNYHIFYEMLSGLSAQERRALHMSGRSVNDFCMTSMSGTIDRRDGVKDCDTFQELRTACDTVGFSRSEQSDLFTVACALLYTSNLTFVEDSVDGSTLDSTNPSLRFALDLLGVDASVLNNALCTCAIEARGETLYKCLSIDRAEKATEALIKATYSALFAYIVRRINCFISNRQDRPVSMVNGLKPRIASIGVLDIFGFESFERNSFEQLCINFCNEALQQQFNRFVFKLEQEEYHREGIDWSFISFPDNQDVLDLIEKRHDGILSVLDEQSRLPQCTDATFASAIYQKCIVHPRFGATKAMQAQLSFAVQHYAGLVEYDSECFLEKNKDELPKETTELLISSSYAFLAMLGKGLAGESQQLNQSSMSSRTPQKGHKQLHRSSSLLRESVGTQFCSQLKVLRTRIESTTPHYVRCLKPNDDLLPHKFDALVIADQLRCAGVLEAVRVSRVGFSNRYYHENFVSRFSLLEPTSIAKHKQKKLKGRELCCILVDLLSPKLIQSLELSNEDLSLSIGGKSFLGLQMGKTKVFIQRKTFEALEGMRTKKQEDSAVLIQAATRMFLKRIDYEIMLFAVILIQKFSRRIDAFRIARGLKAERSAAIIQQGWRCQKAIKLFRAARWIACWSQSAHRGAIARQYCAYVFLDKKASTIQRSWKRHVSTRTFRKIQRAVLRLQTRYRCLLAFRKLRKLRIEARDLGVVAAERDKFKEESNRLRKELEQVKSSPETAQRPPPSPGRAGEIDKLRSEVQTLELELEKAHRMSSPSKSVLDRADELASELRRREEELATLRQEITALRSRDDHSSMKSWSGHGSFTFPSPRHRASPVRSDVSLLDDEIEEEIRTIEESKPTIHAIGEELKHLHTSIRQKNRRHLAQVLQQTSEVCVLVNQIDKYGRTAMHLSALSLDLDIAELLISKGAVVNAQDDDGETPLHLAEKASMTELLIKKGRANPNIPNVDGICALHLAVQRRDVDSVRVLVMNNATVNNADNIKWFTPLHLIALPARQEIDDKENVDNRCRIAQLLTGVYGPTTPDVNYQDSEGNAPLHYAVQLDTDDACDLVHVFLEKNADPNLRNMRDQVPFHLLCHNEKLRSRKNFQEIIHALLLHGADPSIQSRTGCTALHLSLYHKDVDSAVQLIQGGAELHSLWKKPKRWVTFWKEKDGQGVLPLDMVENDDDLYRLLAAITTPQKLARIRSNCMQCDAVLRYSQSVHCRSCSSLICGKCSTVCLPAEYFPKSFNVKAPSWACKICEKILTTRKEVMSNHTQPTSSYGEDCDDEEDRYSC